MLQDIPHMTRQEIYNARYEIAGLIVQSEGLILHLSRDLETRSLATLLRQEIDAARSALLSVTRP